MGYVFTATVSPITATQPVTYLWQATGQTPLEQSSGLSHTVTFTWEAPGTQTITVTVTNAGGTISSTHVVTVASHKLYLPLLMRSYSPSSLSGVSVDAVPPDGWSGRERK